MKKIYLLITVFCIITLSAVSQSWYTIDFEANDSLITIDTSQANNIWQIGTPSKTFLDSAYSAPYAIMTDTVNSYPINVHSSFQFVIHAPQGWSWGNSNVPMFGMVHKFDTDTNYDGGYVEYSIDGGIIWTNIEYVSNTFYDNSTGMDTIIGGIPAITGKSSGWIYSYVIWPYCFIANPPDSVIVRITFQSDSIDNGKEGWLIDDIYIDNDFICEGFVKDQKANNSIQIYPNPTTGKITIENSEYSIQNVSVVDIYGREVLKSEVGSPKLEVDLSQQPKGIYFVKLNTEEGVRVEKVIKN